VPTVGAGESRTVEEAGLRLIDHLEALGRKPTTLNTYSSLQDHPDLRRLRALGA
jgi:hypothetical protein